MELLCQDSQWKYKAHLTTCVGFCIGWQWVKSAPQRGCQLIKNVFLTNHIDPHPARASRRQHQQQCDRFEFQLQ